MFSYFKRIKRTQTGKQHNFRTLYIWLLSYLVIGIILTCCSVFLYTSLIHSTQERVNQTHSEALSKIVTDMDHHLELASRFQTSIAFNENVKQLSFADMSPEEQAHFSMKLGSDLGDLVSATDFSGLYIYFTDKNLVVSNTQANPSEDFFQYTYRDSDLDYETWLTSMQTPNLRNCIIFHKNGNSYLDITFQLPQYDSHSYVYATLAVRMDDKVLKNQLSVSASSNIVILDAQDHVIMRSDNCLGEFHYENFKDGEIVSDKETTTMCKVSEYNNWKYLYIADNSEYTATITKMRIICISFILFSFLLATLLGAIFSIYNYKPLNQLIKIYKKQTGNPSNNNDYAIINDALQDYVESKRNLNSLEVKEQNLKISTYLSRLLKGETVPEGKAPVTFPSSRFSVLLFKPYNNQNLFGEGELQEDEVANTTFFILQNIMEELLSTNGNICYIIRADDLITGICCYKNTQNTQVYKATLHSRILQGMSFIKENFSFDLKLGVSMVCEGTKNLVWAWNEAQLALHMCVENSENLVFYDEIYRKNANFEKQFYASFETKTKHLTTTISNGDKKTALSVLDTIFQHCISSLDVQKSKILLFTLSNAIIDTIDLKQGTESPEMIHNILQSINADNIGETLSTLRHLVEHACMMQSMAATEITSENEDASRIKTTDLVPHIIEYIRVHYTEASLDATSIGSYFDRSSYYISKIFKSATGESPTTYIARLRIENAKSLLKNTTLPLDEVCLQSGFTNEKTFSRTFSKYEGITPSKYRKLYLDEK